MGKLVSVKKASVNLPKIQNRFLVQLTKNEDTKVAQMIKRPPAMRQTQVWSLGWEDPLKKEMETHSSILAWRIPWTLTPVFWPGESHGQRSLEGTVHGVAKSWIQLSDFTFTFKASIQCINLSNSLKLLQYEGFFFFFKGKEMVICTSGRIFPKISTF